MTTGFEGDSAESLAQLRAQVSRAVHTAAILGVLATLLGRVMAPALRGSVAGMDAAIGHLDLAAAIATYLFALAGTATLLRQLALFLRDAAASWAVRAAVTALGTVVVSLVTMSMVLRLATPASVVLGAAATLAAFLCAREALRTPLTRAVGVVLLGLGSASSLHLAGAVTMVTVSDQRVLRWVALARTFSSLSLVLVVLVVMTALLWLSTRKQTSLSWATRLALALALLVAYGALHGARDSAAPWELIANRAAEQLRFVPAPMFAPRGLEYLMSCLALLLAILAIGYRRGMPAVTGALALALLAREATDVPLCALGLTMAAVSAASASRDVRGMWASLLATPHEPSSPISAES